MISVIAAVSDNGVIGVDNTLPWEQPTDLRRFKTLTRDCPIIMGRNTWESLGRPLPRRQNIVVSRGLAGSGLVPAGVVVVESFKDALWYTQYDYERFVIGGASLYALAAKVAARLYLTQIHTVISAENAVKFPLAAYGLLPNNLYNPSRNDELCGALWTLQFDRKIPATDKELAMSYFSYSRPDPLPKRTSNDVGLRTQPAVTNLSLTGPSYIDQNSQFYKTFKSTL